MRKLAFISCVAFALAFSFTSCDEDDIDDFIGGNSDTGLSDDDIVSGLKAALNEGTDSSTSLLSAADGYFKDEAVKLLLPDEVESAISSFQSKSINLGLVTVTGSDLYSGYTNSLLGINIAGVQEKEDDLILGLNRAAEYAAKTAGPVFKDAITGMSVSDGLSILNGADTSATTFLKDNTYNNLFTEYEPIMDDALKQVTVGGKSVVTLYEDYVSSYNDILNYSAAGTSVKDIAGVSDIATTDISEYGTDRALTGLFLKVSDEEKNIRANPFAYVSDIIQKVFGSLFD